MKRTALILTLVAVFGLATAHASKPFVSQFWIDGLGDGDWEDVYLQSGVLKEAIISFGYPVAGQWEGYWQHSGFMTVNPNGTLVAFARGTFTGRILGPDGSSWYTGSVEFVVHTKAKITAEWDILSMSTQWTILRGTGELANLRGHGVEDAAGNDTAWLHFE